MVILLAALLGVLTVGFLLYPFWREKSRTAYPLELLDRLDREIEDEIRALRREREVPPVDVESV